MIKYKLLKIIMLALFLPVLSSCFGINFDIALSNNGSGTITLEYRIAKALDSIGRLDGNERWNTIPVGKADFERSIDRLQNLKLISFSEREDERDLTFNARIEFANMEALLAFLDASGGRSSFNGNAASGHLNLILSEGTVIQNQALDGLLSDIFEPYSFNMTFTFPDRRTASYSYSIYDILTSPDQIVIDLNW